MQTITIKALNEEEFEAITAWLSAMDRATIEIKTGTGFAVTRLLSQWSAAGMDISIIFSPGVVESLGAALSERELLEAAGRAVLVH